MCKGTVSRMRERYALTVLTFWKTFVYQLRKFIHSVRGGRYHPEPSIHFPPLPQAGCCSGYSLACIQKTVFAAVLIPIFRFILSPCPGECWNILYFRICHGSFLPNLHVFAILWTSSLLLSNRAVCEFKSGFLNKSNPRINLSVTWSNCRRYEGWIRFYKICTNRSLDIDGWFCDFFLMP